MNIEQHNTDMAQHCAKMAKHYAELGMDPGWADYARKRIREMMAEAPGLYSNLAKDVTLEVLALKSSAEAQKSGD